LAVELYEPINTLKPVGEGLWVADGTVVRMSYLWGSIPFPTRMVVSRLASGDLFLWSPTEPDGGLRAEIDALGPVRHLVSPNKIHYAHIAAWKRIYPEATAWASPGVRERAASRGLDAPFDADLGDLPEEAWRGDLDQLVFRGSPTTKKTTATNRLPVSSSVKSSPAVRNTTTRVKNTRYGIRLW
jgi:hypothetical protein